jgi:hypothetical protein
MTSLLDARLRRTGNRIIFPMSIMYSTFARKIHELLSGFTLKITFGNIVHFVVNLSFVWLGQNNGYCVTCYVSFRWHLQHKLATFSYQAKMFRKTSARENEKHISCWIKFQAFLTVSYILEQNSVQCLQFGIPISAEPAHTFSLWTESNFRVN